MAKIAIISCNDRCCMGARQLSSLVKDRHAFYLICYGEYHHATFRDTANPGNEADERLLLDLLKRLSPDLVGFSYRSIQANLASYLAGRIRSELKFPVIMGGIGATSEPDVAIQQCDIVCVGEGDFVLPRLLDGIDETKSLDLAVQRTPNIWYHSRAGIAKNALERLVSREELSDFPFIDYDAQNKFTIVQGKLIEDDGRFDNEVGAYPILTSRGCPFSCTFCHNSNVHDLYRGEIYCRQRSVESIILEMDQAKTRFPTKMFSIYDDLFTLNREWALDFASEYRSRIDLPFWCYIHPAKVNKEVHEALLKAGLNNTAMGVQSGSERILYHVFNRRTPRRKILEAASILRELNCRVQIDLITANPFENDDDRRDTLDLMQQMPNITRANNCQQAWYFCQSRLTYFPNSRISKMVEEQRINAAFDPDVASFWEMLNELAFMEDPPQGAVMYLSYLYSKYKESAADFQPATGAQWIRSKLLGRSINEITEIFESDENTNIVDSIGWIPTPEELDYSEVRVLMDAWTATRNEANDSNRDTKVEKARNLLKELTPERRVTRLRQNLRAHADLITRLADAVQTSVAERTRLQAEVDRRGQWSHELDRMIQDRDSTIQRLQSDGIKLQEEVDRRGEWNVDLDRAIEARDSMILKLQSELRRIFPQESKIERKLKTLPILRRLFRRP